MLPENQQHSILANAPALCALPLMDILPKDLPRGGNTGVSDGNHGVIPGTRRRGMYTAIGRLKENGMPVWAVDEEGMPICGGRIPSKPGVICRQRYGQLIKKTGRCHKHSRPDEDARAAGQLASMSLPTRTAYIEKVIAGLFEEALFNPDLLSHATNIATMEVLISKRFDLVSEPPAEIWKEAMECASSMLTETGEFKKDSYENLMAIMNRGADPHANYQRLCKELAPLIKQSTDSKKAESQRLALEENIMTKRDAQLWVRTLVEIVNAVVKDPEARTRIAQEFAKRAGVGTGTGSLTGRRA